MKNKFYTFKNETNISSDLYIYGSITSDKSDDWWPCESDVDLSDFKIALDNLNVNSTLNMYVNSPGGSVFAASTMVSMLQRAKLTKNITIKAYIDGLAASAASFLIMVADEIIVYANSMLMIHKPLSTVWGGNANDFQKEIEILDKIENDIMIPLYQKKSKCDVEKIKELINAESWLSAKEVDNFFNVEILDEEKNIENKFDRNLFKNYKNVPEKFVKEKTITPTNIEPEQQDIVEDTQNIDYSYFEDKLNSMKGDRK